LVPFVVLGLSWIQKSNPLSEDLINVWENYAFMALFEESSHPTNVAKEPQSTNVFGAVSQKSPQVKRILHAYILFANCTSTSDSFRRSDSFGMGRRILLRIRILLGLSWDELKAAICPLRDIVCDDTLRVTELLTLNSNETFFQRVDSDSLLLELQRGGLLAIQAATDRELEWSQIA
jgi:hypothetical protein